MTLEQHEKAEALLTAARHDLREVARRIAELKTLGVEATVTTSLTIEAKAKL